MEETQLAAPISYQRASTLDTIVFFRGSVMSFLAKGEDTGGRFALIEFQSRPGTEPPPHVHDWEHEMLYVLEGELELYSENTVLVVHAGEVVFIPQGTAHAFLIRSSHLRALVMVQAVGEHAVGLDRLILELSEPTKTIGLLEDAISPQDAPGRARCVASSAGVHYLTSAEITCQMPQYPDRRGSYSAMHNMSVKGD